MKNSAKGSASVRHSILCVIVMVFCSTSANATVTLISQARGVGVRNDNRTSETSLGESTSQLPQLYGPFNREFTLSNGPGFPTSITYGSINSIVTPDLLRASGRIQSEGTNGNLINRRGLAAQMFYIVEFSVDVPTPFVAAITYNRLSPSQTSDSSGGADLFMTTAPFTFRSVGGTTLPNFDGLSGVLQPGNYRFEYT